MLRRFILIGAIILVNLLASRLCLGDEGLTAGEAKEMGVEELIEVLQSPSYNDRDSALYGLKRFTNDERVKVALIELLAREMLVIDEKCDALDEGYVEGYYFNLLEIVCKLKDKRAIPLLVEHIGGGIGWIGLTRAIIEMGNASIDPLLDKLKRVLEEDERYAYHYIVDTLAGIAATKELSNEEKAKLKKVFTAAIETLLDRLKIVLEGDKHHEHSDIVGTLAGIAATKELSNNEKTRLRKVFIEAIETLRDRDHYVRRCGIRGLATFGDKESVALIQKVAIEDPYAMKITKGGKPFKTIYPVRDEARKILQELKEEKKNSEDGAK